MVLTKEKQCQLALKLQQSRLRLLQEQPFYGLLLLYMKFSLDIAAGTAYTDGDRIAFAPEFLDSLSDSEVDFVLMHEILHTALSHTQRGENFEDYDAFNIATDVVVNSNILHSCEGNLDVITLHETGEAMHNLPDGREGYDFAAEEIYPIILELKKNKKLNYRNLTSKGRPPVSSGSACGGVSSGSSGDSVSSCDSNDGTPWDNHDKWKNSTREDGCSDRGNGKDNPGRPQYSPQTADEMRNLWLKRMVDATDLINSMAVNITHSSTACGSTPAFMSRILKELREGSIDWRTILQNFVQEDITDYSFSPPDRRFDDSPFFLPDFNETEDSVKNILFMVDTSGSMSDDQISDAFSEIKGALDQFNGRLEGRLGFFDAAVYAPVPFEEINDLREIRPMGGGGTDFGIIFKYVKEKMDEPPASIIILTDGYAAIPPEEAAQGIPVLWLINNEEVTPGWGKVARIKP